MKRRAWTAVFVIGGLAAGLLAGCASSDMKMAGSGDPIADRQQLMKKQGKTMQDITTKLKAGSLDGVAADADTLTGTSQQIPALFPAGSTSPTSRAKPEIWQKKSQFDGYAKSLNDQSKKVAGLARANDLAGTQAAVSEMSRTTCGACHDAFRGPEIKK
jgi:cytochrome c556